MRKLGELYGLVLELIESKHINYICFAIDRLYYRTIISEYELEYLKSDFISTRNIAIDKFGASSIMSSWWSGEDSESRIAFLKHLIKLCKEQDI